MEPTLSQIKEYLREKSINVFEVQGREEESDNELSLFGNGEAEIYFQYYLEHCNEIAEWLTQTE